MQKFTRTVLCDIEIAGEPITVTVDEKGVSLQASGATPKPLAVSWSALLCSVVGKTPTTPTEKDLAAAVASLRGSPAKAANLGEVLSKLDAYLVKHRPGYAKALQPGAKAAALTKLEKSLGFALPEDLRTWLSWHNGQSEELVGCFVESWCLLNTKQIAESYKEQKEEGEALWKDSYVPLLDDNQGDLTVLDAKTGNVVELWRGHDKVEVVGSSLSVWLGQLLADFEAGQYVEEPERGEYMRKSESL